MTKVNRNDPCPCGSGKKYKNCCMRRDQLRESRELGIPPLEGMLLSRLYEFGQSAGFDSDIVQAFALYWGGSYDLGGVRELEEDERRRTLDWFIHDYHTSQDQRYVLDLFIEKQAADLPPEAKEVLEAWRKSLMGMFRILEPFTDGRLALYDCLRRESLEVRDVVLARAAKRGDLVVGRLFELGGVKRLWYTSMLLPGAYEEDMLDYVTKAYERYASDHFRATLDEFLRENSFIFNAYLISPSPAALRVAVGPGTRFADPARSRDKLHRFTEKRLQELRRGVAAEEESLAPPEHRTSGGIILPGAVLEEAQTPQKEEPRPTILIPGRDF